MKIKIKKIHKNAVIPSYTKTGDAGLDLICISKEIKSQYIEYDTGLSMEIPTGYVGLLFSRSSVSKTSHILANGVGVVDSGYRGSIKLRYKKLSYYITMENEEYNIGDRVGQIVIMQVPNIEFKETNKLSDTLRGENGFGSTGA